MKEFISCFEALDEIRFSFNLTNLFFVIWEQSHGFNQLSLTRPSAECREIKNVLFVGASSRPGNGVPLVLIGAKSVAEKAMKRINDLSAINIEDK